MALSSPFAVFAAKKQIGIEGPRRHARCLGKRIVNQPALIDIEMESQAQYAVGKLYAKSTLPTIELQTKPRPEMFAKQAYRKAEFGSVVWGKVMLTDTAVPKKGLEVKGLSPHGKNIVQQTHVEGK